jgi:hypothetical protein
VKIYNYGKTAVGLDCSTRSIAFCEMTVEGPTRWGEINLSGADAFERIHDAKMKMHALGLKADVVAIESAIYVNNMKATISLAYVYGAILGELMDDNSRVYPIEPLKWQTHIGNKLWTKSEKLAFQNKNPGHPKTWYSNEIRGKRKQFTLDFVKNTYGVSLESDNVGDAFGLAHYAKDLFLA